FFEFATHYVAQHKDVKWSQETLGRSFQLSEADWGVLRKDMDKDKIAVSDSLMSADKSFMMRQVRAELASATLGNVERYKIVTEDDTQLNGALDLFPRAAELLTDK